VKTNGDSVFISFTVGMPALLSISTGNMGSGSSQLKSLCGYYIGIFAENYLTNTIG